MAQFLIIYFQGSGYSYALVVNYANGCAPYFSSSPPFNVSFRSVGWVCSVMRLSHQASRRAVPAAAVLLHLVFMRYTQNIINLRLFHRSSHSCMVRVEVLHIFRHQGFSGYIRADCSEILTLLLHRTVLQAPTEPFEVFELCGRELFEGMSFAYKHLAFERKMPS